MHNCTITTESAPEALKIVLSDRLPADLPSIVKTEAEAVQAEKSRKSATIITDAGRFVILKLDDSSWIKDNGENIRILGKQIVDAIRTEKATAGAFISELSDCESRAIAEGIILGDYKFLTCRSGDAAKRDAIAVSLPTANADQVATGIQMAEAQNFARHLGDLPGNLINPQLFLEKATEAFSGIEGIKLKSIYGIDELRDAGFPGLVQVGKAGSTAPALLEIHYTPETTTTDDKLALVGKGLTFDAGGVSLKPAAGMWQMKGDMGGACAVIGAIKAIAALKPAISVTAYIPLAENLMDSVAQRPGDIYQARNGKYIHVDNTDAEGRLVLADVLTYACENGATHMVDAATLTGAVILGLGHSVAAVMGNDSELIESIKTAGEKTGEAWWELPMYPEYRALLDHPHADLNNTGGRPAGTITAGIFLSEFVNEGVKWAHCDIAGTSMQFDKPWRYYDKGLIAFAARSFTQLAEDLASK